MSLEDDSRFIEFYNLVMIRVWVCVGFCGCCCQGRFVLVGCGCVQRECLSVVPHIQPLDFAAPVHSKVLPMVW